MRLIGFNAHFVVHCVCVGLAPEFFHQGFDFLCCKHSLNNPMYGILVCIVMKRDADAHCLTLSVVPCNFPHTKQGNPAISLGV